MNERRGGEGRKDGVRRREKQKKNLVLQRNVKSTKTKWSLQLVKNENLGIKKRSLSDTFLTQSSAKLSVNEN